MPYTALSLKVRCPGYKRDNPQNCTITCMGHEGCRSLQSNFRNKKQLKAFTDRYCLGAYTECPVFRITIEEED